MGISEPITIALQPAIAIRALTFDLCSFQVCKIVCLRQLLTGICMPRHDTHRAQQHLQIVSACDTGGSAKTTTFCCAYEARSLVTRCRSWKKRKNSYTARNPMARKKRPLSRGAVDPTSQFGSEPDFGRQLHQSRRSRRSYKRAIGAGWSRHRPLNSAGRFAKPTTKITGTKKGGLV